MPVTKPASPLARIAALTATILVATGFAAAAPATGVSGAISGTVFRDFDADGVFDMFTGPGVPVDVGVSDVTVTAFNDDGEVATAQTGETGTYVLDLPTQPDGRLLRLQFSGGPAAASATFAGTDNGTSVQFAAVGESGVDFGINLPGDYSNPAAAGAVPVITTIQWAGNPVIGNAIPREEFTVVATPWSAQHTDAQADTADRVGLARFGQTGAIWGSAFDPVGNDLFVSALYRRHSGLGPLGLGGIYRIHGLLGTDGQLAAPDPVENWLDAATLQIAGGGIVDLGSVPSNSARALRLPNSAATDIDAFARTGRVGIGSIAVSGDGRYLTFVNLFDRNLYRIEIANPVEATLIPLGLADDQVPWAVTEHRGLLYVGAVETGTQFVQMTASETATVLVTDAAAPGTWTEVLSVPLDYQKGSNVAQQPTANSARARFWWGWTDIWTDGVSTVEYTIDEPTGDYQSSSTTSRSWHPSRSTRMATSSWASVTGPISKARNQNYPAIAGATYAIVTTLPGGDFLSAAPNGGAFTLESNGVVGDRTTTTTLLNQGPGGLEFFNDTSQFSIPPATAFHHENTYGATATLPGTPQVMATAYALGQTNTTGNLWFGIGDGDRDGYYVQVPSQGLGAPGFDKAGGLGDVSMLAGEAPVQIGNLVWFDANDNGQQDAGEPRIPGVTVELLDGDTVIGTRVTDANGQYYYSTTDADLGGLFVPGGEYTLRFVQPNSGNMLTDDPTYGTIPWTAVEFTDQEVGPDRTIDSNPNPATGEASATVGGPGENDHAYDAGFILAPVQFEVIKEIESPVGLQPNLEFAIEIQIGDSTISTEITEANGYESDPWPVGTAVEVCELGPTAPVPAGYKWAAPLLVGPDGEAAGPDGCLTFILEIDAELQTVTVTNTVVPVPPMPVTGATTLWMLPIALGVLGLGTVIVVVVVMRARLRRA